MRSRKDAFGLVRELGLGLPGVEESTMYGSPALKLRGKMLACMTTNKAADPDSLAVQVGFVNRDLLVVKDPKTSLPPQTLRGIPGGSGAPERHRARRTARDPRDGAPSHVDDCQASKAEAFPQRTTFLTSSDLSSSCSQAHRLAVGLVVLQREAVRPSTSLGAS